MALTWEDKIKLIASGEGGSPGQPYVPPKEDPKNPWVPPPGKNKLQAGGRELREHLKPHTKGRIHGIQEVVLYEVFLLRRY